MGSCGELDMSQTYIQLEEECLKARQLQINTLSSHPPVKRLQVFFCSRIFFNLLWSFKSSRSFRNAEEFLSPLKWKKKYDTSVVYLVSGRTRTALENSWGRDRLGSIKMSITVLEHNFSIAKLTGDGEGSIKLSCTGLCAQYFASKQFFQFHSACLKI